MRKIIDVFIPLLIFPIMGASVGYLVSLFIGSTALVITLGAWGGVIALLILGYFLPDIDE